MALRHILTGLLTGLATLGISHAPLAARPVVDASAPKDVSVTVYRDPDRGERDEMDIDDPLGFAMISETRTVTLPAGESRIRFDGVTEGMVAVTAIVTGLPGGTIEKNRDADLLSPAALVDGTLGNRVQITRTNPATGQSVRERAIVRTRADGGIVLQTAQGFEAVRCAGLPESLSFDRVPNGLSAQPVFSINTNSPEGGTYSVTLTYLSWGFDWQAHYIARLPEKGGEGGAKGTTSFDLFSWLTILNDNGQSFADANLLAVAGALNVESDFEDLSKPPEGEPIRLQCYPIGSTAKGSPVPYYARGVYQSPLPSPPMAMYDEERNVIVVTGARMRREDLATPMPVAAMVADEEQLGDLKLYRIPERVTVAAKGLKQVAFLDRKKVKGRLLFNARCDVDDTESDWGEPDLQPTSVSLETVNDKAHGLGQALPSGGITVFEGSSAGPLLIAEPKLRDHAVSQDVEMPLADESTRVTALCALVSYKDYERAEQGKWANLKAVVRNASHSAQWTRFYFMDDASSFDEDDFTFWIDKPYNLKLGRIKVLRKNGGQAADVLVPAGETLTFNWKVRDPTPDE